MQAYCFELIYTWKIKEFKLLYYCGKKLELLWLDLWVFIN